MRESRSSGSVEGVVSNDHSYSDSKVETDVPEGTAVTVSLVEIHKDSGQGRPYVECADWCRRPLRSSGEAREPLRYRVDYAA